MEKNCFLSDKTARKACQRLILNGVVPIVLGAVLYYLFFPDTIFVKYIDGILGVSCHVPIARNKILLKGMRFYLFDFLWAYALMATVACFWGCGKKYLYIVVAFEVILETSQRIPGMHGTFDICDILTEIAANILVIKNLGGDLENEKSRSV